MKNLFFKASSFYPFLLCEGVNDRELSSSWNRLLSRLSYHFCKTLNYHGMHYCLPVVWGAVSRHLMFSVVQLVSEGSQVIGRGSRHVTACDCGRCRSGPGTPPTVGLSCLNPPPTSTRLTHQKHTIFLIIQINVWIFFFAKDCLLTGQEQACSRITWLFSCSFVTMSKMAQ